MRRQVGKTVGGVPISDEQLETLIDDVATKLQLNEDDVLLDLCCGNGLVTRKLAARCRRVVGLDFSEPLIESARRCSAADNITYELLDVRHVSRLRERHEDRFTKVLMYEALAFFDPGDVTKLLENVGELSPEKPRILLASILDAGAKWRFFNTWPRRWNYIYNILLRGRDPGLGRWWPRATLRSLCRRAGYDAAFMPQPPELHTAHYRIDLLLHPVSQHPEPHDGAR